MFSTDLSIDCTEQAGAWLKETLNYNYNDLVVLGMTV